MMAARESESDRGPFEVKASWSPVVYAYSQAEMEQFRNAFKKLAIAAANTPPDLSLDVVDGDPLTLNELLRSATEELLEFHRVGCERVAAARALYGPPPDAASVA